MTEALTFGVPLLVLHFSTDQFEAAAAVEEHAAGMAFDPNRASRPLIAGSVRGLLRHPLRTPRLLGRELRSDPGLHVAYRAMAEPHAFPESAGLVAGLPVADPGTSQA